MVGAPVAAAGLPDQKVLDVGDAVAHVEELALFAQHRDASRPRPVNPVVDDHSQDEAGPSDASQEDQAHLEPGQALRGRDLLLTVR